MLFDAFEADPDFGGAIITNTGDSAHYAGADHPDLAARMREGYLQSCGT